MWFVDGVRVGLLLLLLLLLGQGVAVVVAAVVNHFAICKMHFRATTMQNKKKQRLLTVF